MAIICMYNTKRMYLEQLVLAGVSDTKICNKPTSPSFSSPLTPAPLGSHFRIRGGDTVGADPISANLPSRGKLRHVCRADLLGSGAEVPSPRA